MNNMKTISKRRLTLLIIDVIIPILTVFILFPLSQKSANSHYYGGIFIGGLYILLAIAFFIYGIKRYKKSHDIIEILFLSLLFVFFVLSGINMCSMECIVCTLGG